MADPAAPPPLDRIPVVAPLQRGFWAAPRSARSGTLQSQGVRRGTAEDQVRRRGRLRRRQARDSRGRRFPAAPRALCASRCHAAPRHPDDRTARHGKDASRPSRGGGGRGPLLLGDRLQFRRDVRRCRGGPRPGPLRRGAQACTGNHLRRRDRRHRPAPWWCGRRRVERRAGADTQPAAGGDGWLRSGNGDCRPCRHQQARGPRSRAPPPRSVRPPGHHPSPDAAGATRHPPGSRPRASNSMPV